MATHEGLREGALPGQPGRRTQVAAVPSYLKLSNTNRKLTAVLHAIGIREIQRGKVI